MLDASDELLVVTLLDNVSTRVANEEENVVPALPTVVMDDANEALLLVIDEAKPSILVAAELLLVVTVLPNEVKDALRDADVG